MTGNSKLKHKWQRWEQSLPKEIAVRQATAEHREPIQIIQLHGFGDVSGHGVLVQPEPGINSSSLRQKARLNKQGLTIPQLELISAHMVTNLLVNVKDSLQRLPATDLNGWLDRHSSSPLDNWQQAV